MSGDSAALSGEAASVRIGVRCGVRWKLCTADNMQKELFANATIRMQYAYNDVKRLASTQTQHIDVRCLVRCMSGDFAAMSGEPAAVRIRVRCGVRWKLCTADNLQMAWWGTQLKYPNSKNELGT